MHYLLRVKVLQQTSHRPQSASLPWILSLRRHRYRAGWIQPAPNIAPSHVATRAVQLHVSKPWLFACFGRLSHDEFGGERARERTPVLFNFQASIAAVDI